LSSIHPPARTIIFLKLRDNPTMSKGKSTVYFN
jgi:hypothetical protein